MRNQQHILVTGAAGFIGSHLVDRLLDRGDYVVGIDNFDPYYPPKIKELNIRGALSNSRFTLYREDFRDQELIERIIREYNVESVIHLAAKVGLRHSIDSPEEYAGINVTGTYHFMSQIETLGVRKFMFASSSSVYGDLAIPFQEDIVPMPIAPYAESKLMGELFCEGIQKRSGMDILCARLFTVYGPRQRPDMVISRFARKMKKGEPVPVIGDGSSVRDYTYVDDIVSGILQFFSTNVGFNIVNIGTGEARSINEVIGVISDVLDVVPTISFMDEISKEVKSTQADVTRAKSLGYSPSVYLEEGIERFLEWLNRMPEDLFDD